MKKLIAVVFLFLCIQCIAQNRNSIWCFGDSAGLDFSSGSPVTFNSGQDSRGSSVSYSDSLGNLVLYACTMPYYGPWNFYCTKVFNSQHQMISNTDSITGEAWYNELVLFPKPGSDSLYQLFSVGVGPGINNGLYVTTIDMSLNGGLGAVVQENIQLDTMVRGDCITAIKHGNGRDWWVISRWSVFSMVQNDRFFVYRVTPDSIIGPITQNLGIATNGDFHKIIWHPFESKFMQVIVTGLMAEYDFDRCTGTISLNRIIFPEQTSNYDRAFFEGAYSPNGNVFYVSRSSYGGVIDDYNYLLQYDLTAANIPASCDTLDVNTFPPTEAGAVRLAPDGKIYYTCFYDWGFPGYPYPDSVHNMYNENLGVINYPDSLGAACDFQPFSFYLGGKRTYYGLPNNPNYSLGALVGSACDTLYTGIKSETDKEPVVYINPNPAHSIIYFNAQHVKGKHAMLHIVSALGESVYEKEIEIFNGGYATQRIDVSGFSNGIYFVSLQTEKEALSKRFIKQ